MFGIVEEYQIKEGYKLKDKNINGIIGRIVLHITLNDDKSCLFSVLLIRIPITFNQAHSIIVIFKISCVKTEK